MKPFTRTVFRTLVGVAAILVVNASAQTRQADSPARSQVKIQPLNVKPGLWETTTNYKTSGAPPIPPETLARLTPEQRARLEERMKAKSGGSTNSATDKHCVTKEDVEKADFGQGKGECTYKIENTTSTQAKGTYSCNAEGVQINGALQIDAPDPEHVSGSSQGTFSAGGKTMNVESTFTSKLIATRCEK